MLPCVGGAGPQLRHGLAYTPRLEGAKRVRHTARLVATPASATEAPHTEKKLSSGRLQQLLQTLSDAKTASSNIVTSRLTGRTASTSAPHPMQSSAYVAEPAATPKPAASPAAEALSRVSIRRRPATRQLPPVPENQPVLELIHRRMQDGSMPGHRQDGFKLGLVVEGGGMRGIVTGAMLMGLLDIGARETFDGVYGASAGAINGCYFLSGQRNGLDIYTDHLAVGDTFLSLKRYWRRNGRPVMDLDYLLDYIMQHVEPLDWEAVIRSPVPLKVVASSLTTLRAEVLDNFADKHDLVQCLKASANVPEIVGGPILHRGQSLVDAAVFQPIPIQTALADGCTHVLALCSRPPHVGSAWGKVVRSALMTAIKRIALNPPYMREAWRVEAEHKMLQGLLLEDALLQMVEAQPAQAAETMGRDGGDEHGHIYPIYPGGAASFAPICTNVETLHLGRQEGVAAVMRLLRPVSARAR